MGAARQAAVFVCTAHMCHLLYPCSCSLSVLSEAVLMVNCATDAWVIEWANANFFTATGKGGREGRVAEGGSPHILPLQ